MDVVINGIRYVPKTKHIAPSDTLRSVMTNRRRELGLTLAEAAHRAGLSVSSVHNIEAGTDPRFSTVAKLAAAYNLDLNTVIATPL